MASRIALGFAAATLWLTVQTACAQPDAAIRPEPVSKRAPQRDLRNDEKAVDALRRIEQKFADIQTISGTFHQTSEDVTFGDKMESQAKFWIKKPNKFRAEYQAPNPSTNLITDQYSYRYVPQIKQVERYRFEGQNPIADLNYMLLGFGVKTDDVMKVYAVKWLTKGVGQGYIGIGFIPRDAESAPFKSLTILATSDDRLLPGQFSMEQLDGGRITANIDLATLQMGAQLDDRTFRPDFPRDAAIVDIR